MSTYTRERFLAAYKLLSEETTNLEKFESVKKLIFGLNPKVDKILNTCSETLSKMEKVQKGEIIELTADQLPEDTEEEKKRKRAILLFIRSWKDLKSEVERVKNELDSGEQKNFDQKIESGAKIISYAKGPFGIITILAAIVVGIFIIVNSQSKTAQTSPQTTPSSEIKPKTQVINFNDKKIPLNELTTGVGPECLTNGKGVSHYHAKDHQAARAIDGSMVEDPGGCGFGKVDEVAVLEI